MQQPSIGLSDLTNLECMAIPTKESSEVSAKVEAVLSNIQQRYKKDQIYVSYVNDFLQFCFGTYALVLVLVLN